MSDIANIIRGVQEDYKAIFYSEPMAALKVPVTIQSGYGVLKVGTALAKNLSAGTAGGKDQLVPYNPTTFSASGSEDHPGRIFLVADSGTTASDLYATIADSYKVKVGDDLIINDNTTSAENLGAITAIDRTTESHRAKITVTTATGGTSFTTARFAHVFVEAGTSANNYSDCVGILEKSVDTGVGENAKGAYATLLISNMTLYTGMLVNFDSAAQTDLSASTFGNHTIIK